MAKHDIEVVVYTAAESILAGNTCRNKLVDASSEADTTRCGCKVLAAEMITE